MLYISKLCNCYLFILLFFFKEFIQNVRETKQNIIKSHKAEDNDDFIPLESEKKPSVLDRFKPKTPKKKT